VTRNAVIGKVHRLGLSNRTAPGKPGAPEEVEAIAAADIEAAPVATAPAAPEPVVEAAPEPAAPPATPRPAVRDPQRREPAPMTEDRREALANLAEIEKTARRVSLLDLTERVCKWPIGDPTEPNFHFCGLPASPGKPYCAAHVAVAFQPMSSRRDRDRQRIRG
jgi:GcrA cell cycle regulator